MKSMRFLLAAALVATCALGFARSEPNSFLNKSAWTHEALMTQVRTDPKVMSRFTRHFGMTQPEVIDTLGRLRAGTLKQDGVYLVYNCNDNEEIRAKVIFYKKGTKVWEDANGTPILKMSCANPMVRGTDDQLAVLQPEVTPSDNLRPVSIVANGAPAGEVETDIVAVEPDSSAQVLGAAAVAIPAIGTSSVVGAAAFNPLVLAPLAGLGLIRTGTSPGDETPPPPVPEPATMLLLGAGAAAMAVKKAKQAKKQ